MQADVTVGVDGSSAENSVLDIPSELVPMKEKLCLLYKKLADTSKFRLPTLQSVPRNKLGGILSDVNEVLPSIPTANIDELRYLMYCAAVLVTDMCGCKVQQPDFVPCVHIPPWKVRLTSQLKNLQADLCRLNELKHNRLHNQQTLQRLHILYQLGSSADLTTYEVIHQKIYAYSCRLKQYEY